MEQNVKEVFAIDLEIRDTFDYNTFYMRDVFTAIFEINSQINHVVKADIGELRSTDEQVTAIIYNCYNPLSTHFQQAETGFV